MALRKFVVLFLAPFFLYGCVIGSKDDAIDEGRFIVDADCEKKRVKVELDLDRINSDKEIRVTK